MRKIALILAAGDGKRLDRTHTPKPLVKVCETPIIVRLIDQMFELGIEDIFLVVGYEKEKLIQALKLHYVNQSQLKLHFVENDHWQEGIVSSVKQALVHIKHIFNQQSILLSMGDHIFEQNHIKEILDVSPELGHCHILVDGRIEAFDPTDIEQAVKIKKSGHLIENIGFQVPSFNALDAGLFSFYIDDWLDLIAQNSKAVTLPELLLPLCQDQKLSAVEMKNGQWHDIDTPIDLIHAEMTLRREKRIRSVNVPSPKHDLFGQYDFIAGKPELTQMLVGRGIFKDPSRIELIPSESASSPIFIFTDETVAPLYAIPLETKLKSYGYRTNLIVMKDGEESKSLNNYVKLTEKVLSLGVDEKSVFISVGGGVVCNVCGFIASTIYRGLDLVHLPTSLMAQCDAAISHKQAINGYLGKNMVGAYYSPRMVAVDVEALLTLDERLMKDGMAEVIKHALCKDEGYVDLLLKHQGDFIRDLDLLEEVIRRNVAHKCRLSKEDPKELSEGMVLQYGHTVGHPIEHLSGYSLYHGESVAIGMMVEVRVSRLLGVCGDDLVELHETLLRKFGLPVKVPKEISCADMLKTLRYNKRYLTEGTRMPLLSQAGQMWHVKGDYAIPVPTEVLIEAFEQSKEK